MATFTQADIERVTADQANMITATGNRWPAGDPPRINGTKDQHQQVIAVVAGEVAKLLPAIKAELAKTPGLSDVLTDDLLVDASSRCIDEDMAARLEALKEAEGVGETKSRSVAETIKRERRRR